MEKIKQIQSKLLKKSVEDSEGNELKIGDFVIIICKIKGVTGSFEDDLILELPDGGEVTVPNYVVTKN